MFLEGFDNFGFGCDNFEVWVMCWFFIVKVVGVFGLVFWVDDDFIVFGMLYVGGVYFFGYSFW